MGSFDQLTPEKILPVVEAAIGTKLTGLIIPLPSYINRVNELRAVDGTKLIVKFYRPDRWSRAALANEHQFLNDAAEDEIPVVEPLTLLNGQTIDEYEGIYFTLFPKRAGRQFEVNQESDWLRIGSLLARLHNVGSRDRAPDRVVYHPSNSTKNDVEYICSKVIPERFRNSFSAIGQAIISASIPLFEGIQSIRIHGDCHRGNILDRLEEGLLLIDFDDMVTGPPVQDLWLLLPDRVDKSGMEIEYFIEGYERFRRFDRASLRCIESLRAMRMIYFLAWCSRQQQDHLFKRNFPDWGSDTFWQREINDLREQLGFINDNFSNEQEEEI